MYLWLGITPEATQLKCDALKSSRVSSTSFASSNHHGVMMAILFQLWAIEPLAHQGGCLTNFLGYNKLYNANSLGLALYFLPRQIPAFTLNEGICRLTQDNTFLLF